MSLGLAVLRALPPRADDPLRGVVHQAAWRLGVTGLSGALLGGARIGAYALDDRLRLGGRLAALPLSIRGFSGWKVSRTPPEKPA